MPKTKYPDQWRRSFIFSILVSVLAIAITALLGLRTIEKPVMWKGESAFKAEHAYEWTRALAQGYPNRVPWRPEKIAAATYLKNQFKNLGYSPQSMPFSETIGGKKFENLENVYAVLPAGKISDEYIVVLAHYDVTDTTAEGATDDASGVGIVLELARLYKHLPAPNRNIVFLLTDSEEFGAFWGAHQFAARFPHAKNIVAAISLDFVAPDHQKSIMVLVDGLQRGYAPLWLREMAIEAVRMAPIEVEDTQNVLEFVQRALLIPPADHGAFLMAGIPAINYFGKSDDFTYQMAKIHHTPEDNMSHLHKESFVPFGRAAETLLRSVDALPRMLDSPTLRQSSYFKLSDSRYLAGAYAWLIQFFLFIPFGTYVVHLFGNLRRNRSHIKKVLRNEAKGLIIAMVSLLLGYILLRFMPDLEIITKYEMFPATQKSKILYSPEPLALLLVFFLIGSAYFILSKLFSNRRDDALSDPVDLQIRHALLGTTLGVVVLMAFAKNSHLATLMLLPPSYLWMFMKNNRAQDSRLLNALLFAGGFFSLIAICTAMSSIFHIGAIYWYLFLSLSYGLVSLYAAVLALIVLAIGIRILRNLIL